MMVKHPIRVTMAGAALVAGAALAVPSVASASGAVTNTSFTQSQQKLEKQLGLRLTQLGRLSLDIKSSTTLTPTDAGVLAARISGETSNMEQLVTAAQAAKTQAELNAIHRVMVQDNRVFAVETPQVFEVIEADSISAQVTTYEAAEPALQAAVTSAEGTAGYKNAEVHYNDYVTAVTRAGTDSARVSTTVIVQVPQDYPADAKIFVHANRQLLKANDELADASYDQTVIGLAIGGYTGS